MSADSDWIKLEKVNDYGSIFYRLSNVRFSPNKGGQKVLHAFDQIEIRWPDGTEDVVDVATKYFRENWTEGLEAFSVGNYLPVVTVNHHGIEVLVEFDRIEIRRRCLKGPGFLGPHYDPDDDPDGGERMCA